MKSSTMIGGASTENKRHDSDYYPTPSEVTIALMEFLKLGRTLIGWDCACGDGSMVKVLQRYLNIVAASDIRDDTGFGVSGVDFLTMKEKIGTAIITNPPFSLGEQFIRKCYELNPPVYAKLLKSTYWQASSRYELFQTTKPAFILPLTWRPVFVPNRGTSPTMDFCWTVWMNNMKGKTTYVPLRKPVSPS